MKQPQFAKHIGVQRYQRHDPNPHIPFHRKPEPLLTKVEAVLYGCGWGFALGVIFLTEWAR